MGGMILEDEEEGMCDCFHKRKEKIMTIPWVQDLHVRWAGMAPISIQPGALLILSIAFYILIIYAVAVAVSANLMGGKDQGVDEINSTLTLNVSHVPINSTCNSTILRILKPNTKIGSLNEIKPELSKNNTRDIIN